MKAVLVMPTPGRYEGGVERFCAHLAPVLRAEGFEVEEVGPAPAGEPGPWARRLGLPPVQAARSAGRAAHGRGADLVITNGSLGAGAPRDVARVHVFHGTMAHHIWHGERAGLPRREVARGIVSHGLAEVLSARGATTVAVAESVAREVRTTYRRRVDEVLPLGVDVARFAPRDRAEARSRLGLPADAALALYVGRVEPRKGGDLLAPVCAAAGVELVVAGAGAPAGAHELGTLGHDELPWAYAAADAVLFPTRYEGFGYVALEALACERPLVTTPTGWAAGLPRAVPGFAPFVVAPELEPLARALRAAVGGGQDALLPRAAAHVRDELSLARFEARWAALLRRVSAGAAATA